MKTKQLFASLLIAALTITMGLTSCKKKKAFKEENGQASEDSRAAMGETDAVMAESNAAMGETKSLHGRYNSNQAIAPLATPCGYSVDTASAFASGMIKINYNGTVCSNRKREGSIRLTIQDYASGKRWKTAGCVVKVEYLGYKVTRASDDKSIELNGVQYVTNVTGGTWVELVFGQPNLVHTVTGNDLSVKFNGDKTATYNINRKFTYTVSGIVFTCTGEGIGSSDGISNLENYGITRDGDAFTSQVTTPVVWNTTCGSRAPIKGEVNIKVEDKEFTLNCLFGTDASGNSVNTAANDCPYGFKVQWTHKSKTNKKVFGYY